MKIQGKYTITVPVCTMFLNQTIRIHGENLITLLGESFFMNRWINEELAPLQYIVLGKGTRRPQKNDLELSYETCRKIATPKVDLQNKELVLSASFSAEEIIDTTEIGTHTGEILVSHDLFKAINQNLILGDKTSTVNIDYSFSLSTGSLRSGWTASTEDNRIYYIYEPNTVQSVTEENTGSGYTQKNSIAELQTASATYYHDPKTKNLYIRTSKDSNPDLEEIIVENK